MGYVLAAPASGDYTRIDTVRHVPTNAALRALSVPAAGSAVIRQGRRAPGDGGAAFYVFSSSPCSAPDDAAQVSPASGTGCWNADFSVIHANVKQWDAHGNGVADDSAAINTAIAAADALGLGGIELPFTPQFYGVCASHITLNPTGPFQLTAPKGTAIKVLPSCNSPPNEVLYVNALTPTTDLIYRAESVISGLTLDGSCLSKYVLNHNRGQGFAYHDMLIRNAAPASVSASSADVLFAAGNERHLGYGNTIANENEPGHRCYRSMASMVAFGVYANGGNDDFSGLIVVNAKTGIYNSGGDNTFGPGTHVWGGLDVDSSGNTVYNADLRTNVGIDVVGNGTVVGLEVDDPVQAAVFIENGGSGGSIAVTDVLCRYQPSGPTNTQKCVEIVSGTINAEVFGTMAPQMVANGFPQNIVVQDGTKGCLGRSGGSSGACVDSVFHSGIQMRNRQARRQAQQ
jgi:hypothetical protein